MHSTLIEQKIDAIIKRKISEDTPGFSLMIAQGENIIVNKGYGMADIEKHIPIKPDDNFIIASNTKQFTCFALLMLQQRGLVNIDDSPQKFFPDFPDYIKHITIRQMMCHTTGIKEYFSENFKQNESLMAKANTKQLLNMIKGFGENLDFEPNTKFSYCNSAYVMLGDIIRQLSGKQFGNFIETEILKPLGMDHSFAPDYMDNKDPYLVKGYKQIEEGKFIELPYDMIQVGYADGNISSNTADLFTWHKYIYMSDSELLLKRSLLKEAFKPHIFANGTPVKYGLGFFLGEIEDHSPAYNRLGEIWHTGGTEGFVSRCSRFTEADTTITMLTNYDGLDKEELFFPIADEVFREA
jgi:CubicO group peptidase (beta-lactamase class C family)